MAILAMICAVVVSNNASHGYATVDEPGAGCVITSVYQANGNNHALQWIIGWCADSRGERERKPTRAGGARTQPELQAWVDTAITLASSMH